MAIPTVEEAINEASFHLGDMAQRRFNTAELGLAVGIAWRELIDEMIKCQDATVELQAVYTLPAGTSSLLPATAGIDNFGAPIRLEERPAGSAEGYSSVTYTEVLPSPWSAGPQLVYYNWRANTFFFNAASADVQLKITYQASGALPVTGSLGIDNCLTVVSKLAASLIARTKGDRDKSVILRNEVYRDPNHMQALIQPNLRVQQERRIQMAAYSVGSNRRRNIGQPYTP